MKKCLRWVLVAVVLVLVVPVLTGCKISFGRGNNDDGGHDHGGENPPVIEYGDLSIHFLELGNRYTGDSIYINYGDVDILIDAGSRQGSAVTINEYLGQYVADGKLEYVIATHAHQDHIAGFYGNSDGKGGRTGVLYNFLVGTIIDYARTNSTSAIKTNYEDGARAYAVENGAVHFTAADCFDEVGDAKRVYQIAEGVELEILYNYYYFNKASDENDYSVCVMLRQGERQYLFTGDLEESGEGKLVDYYAERGGLGHCVVYKAGHHGSKTSSTAKLLGAITPEYVFVCACAGDDEYTDNVDNQFPTKDFCMRIAVYTDKVYVTTVSLDNETHAFGSMNGNIMFKVSDDVISVVGSNNNTLLKDTEWFAGRGWGTWGEWTG